MSSNSGNQFSGSWHRCGSSGNEKEQSMVNWHEWAEVIFHEHLKLECGKRILILFLFIIIFLIIIKSIFPCIDMRWWLNLIGLSLNLLAALIIGEGTIIKSYNTSLNAENKQVFYQQGYFLKIGTNLLLVGFSLQLISLIIPV
jgi:hypothetical protein